MKNMVLIVREDLNLLQRTLCCAMMVMDVHCRDTIQNLIRDDISTLDDFNW